MQTAGLSTLKPINFADDYKRRLLRPEDFDSDSS